MRQRHTSRPVPRPGPGRVARYLGYLAIALLPACQSGEPDSAFKRYLNQLDLALSVAVPAIEHVTAAPVPGAGELQLAIPPGDIDGLDFLQLGSCALQANFVKRQTRLAQFAKPSQRLLLELEYLRLAPACIQRLRDGGRHPLADQLEAARREKQGQLPALIFNATLGSDEYRSFWLAAPITGEYPRSDSSAAVSALETINHQTRRWLSGDYRARNRAFELLLSEIAGGGGGQKRRAWSRQVDWLVAADTIAGQSLASAAVCSAVNVNPMTRRRLALARSYFTGVIQPLATQSQLHYLEMEAPVAALEAQLSAILPPRYRRWLTDRNQHVAALASAPGQHLAQLDRIQQGCNTEAGLAAR
ncbi:MAG: DUF3080 family protein [Halioglobus sp.]|nr:DUF3080 family protein [Halioglobus sp.]